MDEETRKSLEAYKKRRAEMSVFYKPVVKLLRDRVLNNSAWNNGTADDILALASLGRVCRRIAHSDDEVERALLKAAADFGESAATPDDLKAFAEIADVALSWG